VARFSSDDYELVEENPLDYHAKSAGEAWSSSVTADWLTGVDYGVTRSCTVTYVWLQGTVPDLLQELRQRQPS
jgi:hypothetical protein